MTQTRIRHTIGGAFYLVLFQLYLSATVNRDNCKNAGIIDAGTKENPWDCKQGSCGTRSTAIYRVFTV